VIVRYTRQALADLDEAREYVALDRPAAAQAIGQRIRQVISDLPGSRSEGGPAE